MQFFTADRRIPASGTPRRALLLAASALGAAIFGTAGCQQTSGPYPSHEIKLIVQASPGGISDTVSRFMASLVEKDLGVPVVCENKPGASGALAFSYVTRRPADGYTLGHAPVEIAMVRALGYADIGPRDMELICLVSRTPPALVVQADSPWKTLEDFVTAARAKPGDLILANSGIGSIWHFNTLLLERAARIRVTHLPYPGSSAAVVSLLGGHVDGLVAGVGEVVANVNSGHLRVLAVLDQTRSGIFPDAPTTHELGYTIGTPAWSGFFGPKGLPQDHLRRLEQAFRSGFETDAWRKLCAERGMEATFLDTTQFREFALQQAEFFGSEIPSLVGGQQQARAAGVSPGTRLLSFLALRFVAQGPRFPATGAFAILPRPPAPAW
jgi:tripartite-type tricarboxylate transporter receptor subunit TctC